MELFDIEMSVFLKSQSSKREKNTVRKNIFITFNSRIFAQGLILNAPYLGTCGKLTTHSFHTYSAKAYLSVRHTEIPGERHGFCPQGV